MKVILPFIPIVTTGVNYILPLEGGRYELYQETRIIRHIVLNVWYEVVDFNTHQEAVRFVNFANSL